MLRSSALIALIGLWLVAPAARAAEPPHHVVLRYNAPDACPDDAQLIGLVEGFLGQPLREAREQELAALVNVLGAGAGYSAKLTFTSPRGTEERFVEDADCSKLAEAAALLVALAIDPERVHAKQAAAEGAPEPAPLEPPPEPEPKPTVAPPVSEPCPEPAPPARVPERRVFAGARAFAGVGVVPGLTPGFNVDFGARWGHWRGAVVGTYWLPSRSETALNGSEIEISLVTAGLRGCWAQPLREWTALACVQGELGQMSGSGQHVDAAVTQHELFSALQLQAFAQFSKVEPAPLVGLGLSWNLARPAFGVTPNAVLPIQADFRPRTVGLLAYLGISLGP